MLIKNFSDLATTPEREKVLQIVEAGLQAIQPEQVINVQVSTSNNQLKIGEQEIDLEKYQRIFLVGFGKGAAKISKLVVERLRGSEEGRKKFNNGHVIDVEKEELPGIEFTVGTHPVPSQINVDFTNIVLSNLSSLQPSDLVLVVVCGGGSALFTSPTISLDKLAEVNKELLKSGLDITQMNSIRKKLDRVKGGGLAKILYPAKVVGLIFSDVPGNDLSTIASGPLVKDDTSFEDTVRIVAEKSFSLRSEDLQETPKEDKYFENVSNVLVLSNLTALEAMKRRAEELGMEAEIVTDRMEGEAREVAQEEVRRLAGQEVRNKVFLFGGETTVTAKGNGKGGRNQELVLSALTMQQFNNITICSVGTDGWDNTDHAGAIADLQASQIVADEAEKYLKDNDSYHFFEKYGGAIVTGHLPSNVADLTVVMKVN